MKTLRVVVLLVALLSICQHGYATAWQSTGMYYKSTSTFNLWDGPNYKPVQEFIQVNTSSTRIWGRYWFSDWTGKTKLGDDYVSYRLYGVCDFDLPLDVANDGRFIDFPKQIYIDVWSEHFPTPRSIPVNVWFQTCRVRNFWNYGPSYIFEMDAYISEMCGYLDWEGNYLEVNGHAVFSTEVTPVSSVPEPSTWVGIGVGVLFLGFLILRSRKKKPQYETTDIPVNCPYYGMIRYSSGNGMFFHDDDELNCGLQGCGSKCLMIRPNKEIEWEKCGYNCSANTEWLKNIEKERVSLQSLGREIEGFDYYSDVTKDVYVELMKKYPRIYRYKEKIVNE